MRYRIKRLRDWSDDALWIGWAIGATAAVIAVCLLWMPPS